MDSWTASVVEQLGHVGILLLMLLENLIPPIPSELVMPLGGYTSARGELSFAGVVVAGTAGSVLGALALYGLGAWLGRERLERWVARHGVWLTLSRRDLQRAYRWFERHGKGVVLFGRLVPGVRSLVSIPAGVVRMPLVPFLALTVLGSAAWTLLLAWLGWLLGARYESVGSALDPIVYALLAALAVTYLVRLVRLLHARRAA